MTQTLNNIYIDKYNSEVLIVPDKNDKHKSYIMIEGYIIGVQVNTGTLG